MENSKIIKTFTKFLLKVTVNKHKTQSVIGSGRDEATVLVQQIVTQQLGVRQLTSEHVNRGDTDGFAMITFEARLLTRYIIESPPDKLGPSPGRTKVRRGADGGWSQCLQ